MVWVEECRLLLNPFIEMNGVNDALSNVNSLFKRKA